MDVSYLAYKVPKWLMSLPSGVYTIGDISNLTKASPQNIYMRFEALNVKRKKVREGDYWRNIYMWKGAAFYIKKSYESAISKVPR